MCAKKVETGEKKRQLLAYKNGVFLGLNELVFSKKKRLHVVLKKKAKKIRFGAWFWGKNLRKPAILVQSAGDLRLI